MLTPHETRVEQLLLQIQRHLKNIECSPVPPSDPEASFVQRRIELSGITTWTRPDNIQSMTINVRTVGDVLNRPTITDSNATVTDLFAGDIETWSALGQSDVLQGSFVITQTHVNDRITIFYTERI